MLLAHLTDIHVADPNDYVDPHVQQKVKKHSVDHLRRLLVDLHAQRPDHLILTGDLTQTSLPNEFVGARQHLDQLLPGLRVSAIPGNHDAWHADAKNHFLRTFGDHARCDLTGSEGPPYCHLVGDQVAVVALDSTPHVPGVDPASVKGLVDRPQLDKLAELVHAVRDRFVLVILHHHLRLSDEDASRPDPKDGSPLENAAEVEAAIAALPVGAVLHGHRHAQMRLDLPVNGRLLPVLCPGSGSRVHESPKRTARYSLYHIRDGKLVVVRTRAFDPVRNTMVWS